MALNRRAFFSAIAGAPAVGIAQAPEQPKFLQIPYGMMCCACGTWVMNQKPLSETGPKGYFLVSCGNGKCKNFGIPTRVSV